MVVVVALFWAARVLLARPFRTRQAALRLLTLGAALVAGTALAALVLIPFVELLNHSIDVQIRTASDSHEPARYLLGIFLHDYWGHARTSIEFASALEEHAYYVAALPLMLAAVALIVRRRPERLAVAAVGAASLAVATGIPPFFDVVTRLPGFDAARNGRFAVITVLCVAVLAGWGLDDLSGRRIPAARRRVVLGVGLGLLILPVVIVAGSVHLHALGSAFRVAWGFATPTAGLASRAGGGIVGLVHLASLLEWLVVAAAALGAAGVSAARPVGCRGVRRARGGC